MATSDQIEISRTLEDVFVTEGVPQETFVYPPNYSEILVDVRQAKKPVVIEGPSGTGKTVTIKKIIEDLRGKAAVDYLSARHAEHVYQLTQLADCPRAGSFVVDDFHRLPNELQAKLGEIAKLAAESSGGAALPKLILIGINQVGSTLIEFTPDIAKRIGIHRISPANLDKTRELIARGEAALRIRLNNIDDVHQESKGDYWLTQTICKYACLLNNVTETAPSAHEVSVDVARIRERVIQNMGAAYTGAIAEFCKGRRFRPSNDAYFNVLRAIAGRGESSVDLTVLAHGQPLLRQTINNIKDRRLAVLLEGKPKARQYFYYNASTKQFLIEDPAVLYFLRHLDWDRFRKQCGFRAEEPDEFEWEVAISFAGERRWLAEFLHGALEDVDVRVFYDAAQDAMLLGKSLTDEFQRVFSEKSKFILVILDKNYEIKDWTRFEKEIFAFKVKTARVLPLTLDDTSHVGLPKEVKGFHMAHIVDQPDGWEDDVRRKVVEPILGLLA